MAWARETVSKRTAGSRQFRIFWITFFPPDFLVLLSAQCLLSLNHFVRPRQHVRWNRQADLLGRFKVDNELELLRLLHGKVGGFGTFQDLVHVNSSTTVQVGQAHAVGHKPPGFHVFSPTVYRRELALYREFCNLLVRERDRTSHQQEDCVRPALFCSLECSFETLGNPHLYVLQLHSENPGSQFGLFQHLYVPWNGRIPEHGQARELGNDLLQKLQPLSA